MSISSNLIIASNPTKDKKLNRDFKMSMVKIQSAIYTPDFFGEDLNLCDLNIAYRETGEGDTALHLYQLHHITKQWSNDGAGTYITMRVQHSENFNLTQYGVKELLMLNFAEQYI